MSNDIKNWAKKQRVGDRKIMKVNFELKRDGNAFWGFFCRGEYWSVQFHNHLDYLNNYPVVKLSIDEQFASIKPDEQSAVIDVFKKYQKVMKYYMLVFLTDAPYPLQKAEYETLLKFEFLNLKEKEFIESAILGFTYLYLIKDKHTGYIKIGRSNDPFQRLKTLIKQDTLMPSENDFVLLHALAARPEEELRIHSIYSSQRIRGEWFNLSEKDIYAIWGEFPNERDLVTGKTSEEEANRETQESINEWVKK